MKYLVGIDKMVKNIGNILRGRLQGRQRKLQKELNKVREKVKVQEEEIASYERKYNRMVKEVRESKRELKRDEKRIVEMEERIEKLVKEESKTKKRIKRLTKEKKHVEDERSKASKQLEEYIRKEREEKKQGVHVETLIKELSEKEEENKRLGKEIQQIKREKEDREKVLVSHINGEKRAKERVSSILGEKERQIWELTKEQKEWGIKERRLGNRIEELEREVLSERQKQVKYQEDVDGMLVGLFERLDITTVGRYKKLGDLYKRYEEVKKEKEKEERFIKEDVGYVRSKNGRLYYITSKDKRIGEVTDTEGYQLRNGDVCRVKIYEDKIKLVEVFKENKLRRYKRNQTLKKGMEEKTEAGKDSGYIPGFEEDLEGKEILVVTAKGLQRYRNYFKRYTNIEIVDPYSEGERKMRQLIQRATAVVVRTDAVPHSVTDYVKERYKDKTQMLYNPTSTDVKNAIVDVVKGLQKAN